MIVSCGEALIDFVPARTTAGEGAYVARPGGSPFNVAVTVGRLGYPAGFLGSVSSDFFGGQLLAALHKSNVDARYVSRLDRPSTLAFVNLESVEPEYTFYDSEAAHRFWAPGGEIARDVTLLHFGSLSLIDEPAADHFAQLIVCTKGRCGLACRGRLDRGRDGRRRRFDGLCARRAHDSACRTADQAVRHRGRRRQFYGCAAGRARCRGRHNARRACAHR